MSAEVDGKFETIERQKAKELKKSSWWKNKIQSTACYYCGKSLNKTTATLDHIVPISRGGTTVKGNIVVACKSCNQAKKSMTAIEFEEFVRARRG